MHLLQINFPLACLLNPFYKKNHPKPLNAYIYTNIWTVSNPLPPIPYGDYANFSCRWNNNNSEWTLWFIFNHHQKYGLMQMHTYKANVDGNKKSNDQNKEDL